MFLPSLKKKKDIDLVFKLTPATLRSQRSLTELTLIGNFQNYKTCRRKLNICFSNEYF